MSSAAVAIVSRVLEGALVPRNSLLSRPHVARLLVWSGLVSSPRDELARRLVLSRWSPPGCSFQRVRSLLVMLGSSCLRSALRLVVGRLSFTRNYVPRSSGRTDLHPSHRQRRAGRPALVISSTVTRPVALVAARCAYRKRLPLTSAGTDWSVLSSVARVAVRSLVTSAPRKLARRSVRSWLVTRSRDLLSNGVVPIGVFSQFEPMRSLRARRLASRAFSFRSPRAR
jgi:hypothetical protein